MTVPPASMVLPGQIPSVVSLALAQARSLLSSDPFATAKVESGGEASAHGNRVADVARACNASTHIGLGTASGIHPTPKGSGLSMSALLAEAWLDEFPGPRRDDLMDVVLPFDKASLERAVDHFFQQLDELDVRDLVGGDLTHVVFLSLGVATAVAALEVARRRLSRRTDGGKGVRLRVTLGSGDDLGFPDLPGSWSSRLT